MSYADKLMVKAIAILNDRNEAEAVKLLSLCTGIEEEIDEKGWGGEPILVTLSGPPRLAGAFVHKTLDRGENFSPIDPLGQAIEKAFDDAHNGSVPDPGMGGTVFVCGRVFVPDADTDWRTLLIRQGQKSEEKAMEWTEILGADKQNVLF